MLETILIRFGCRCVVVPNGAEAISCAMGDVAFDVIFMDLLMPISKFFVTDFLLISSHGRVIRMLFLELS